MGGMQMIAAVYSVLVVTSFVCAAATGNLGYLSAGLFDGVERSVGLVCSLVGTMSIWGGVLSALDSAGAVTLLSRAFSPVIRLFLPCASRDAESVRAISMSMAANRNPKIRAALCLSPKMAELARKDNDANVLCLPALFLKKRKAINIVKIFLTTSFEGGRHARRIKKISGEK